MANRQVTVLASAIRTASVTTITNLVSSDNPEAVIYTINVTLDAASAIITPVIQGFDALGEVWTTILTGAAIAATGTTQLRFGIGLPVTTNLSANHAIPSRFRLVITATDSDALTYSVGAEIVNK